MVIQLRRLEEIIDLAKSYGVKVVVNYDDSDLAVSNRLEYDEINVNVEQDNPNSEWQASIMTSIQLDLWARFKSIYVDHEERVIYVDV